MSTTFWRKDLPTIILAFLGFTLIAQAIFNVKELNDLRAWFGLIPTVIAYIAFGVGTVYGVTAEINMWKRNRTLKQGIITGSFFLMMALMVVVAVLYGGLESWRKPEFRWYLLNIYQPQSQGMYAVMFLYQCGAVYRVLRFRNWETAVLIISGVGFILSQIPLFTAYIPFMSAFGEFVAKYPSLGGTRPANVTGAVGGIIVALRALIGKEQGTMAIGGG
ncbi:hypothetical protein FJY84_01360 [Candidatus Bathyarchaeota archaeon]|nr:hypothetical protein [Candidatus Bathyarchaeota archaeon]